jgi:hypothetical protein
MYIKPGGGGGQGGERERDKSFEGAMLEGRVGSRLRERARERESMRS